ncbi:MAG TPA: phosphoglycerate kinase [Candidatus Portnoybacteria bacterium]|nr:phosphoglycerate kinase [Candidatus Portnoybacteria bacterium]
MKTVEDIDLINKRVLIRADFNLPIKDGQITDDFRLKASCPTIKFCLEKKAKIVLISHLDQPGGKVDPAYSLKPVAERLSELLEKPVRMIEDCLGEKVKEEVAKMEPGEIFLLENLRFYPEEEANDSAFAQKLASLAEIYINDAFGSSHRAHASIVELAEHLPAVAGLLLKKEVEILSKSLESPAQPALAIIGGAKIKVKLPVIESLSKKYDQVLVGGKIANEIVDNQLSVSRNVKLPLDYVFEGEKKLDIGAKTSKEYTQVISQAKTIIWNGPMGVFEKERFVKGTEDIARAVVQSSAYTVIGGGETIAALNKFGLLEKIDHVSTGGGAMLEFLAGQELPGLKALE